jgi:hypothetical protein
MSLLRSGKPIGTIFDLLGRKEDDMTYALGFVASRSLRFTAALVTAVGCPSGEPRDGTVRLQEVDREGRTDVEIEWPGQFHAVFEAKRGPWLPTEEQLQRYVDRLRGSAAAILGMENARSNMVYVLSLGSGGVWGLNFRDVVTSHHSYFDPVKRYRSGLPNYMAFRYDARLQTIHHVEGTTVFQNPRSVLGGAEDCQVEPHYLFRLGPPIKPPHAVPNGPIIRQAMRVWCMLDLLLTSATITDALRETKRRLGDGADETEDDES